MALPTLEELNGETTAAHGGAAATLEENGEKLPTLEELNGEKLPTLEELNGEKLPTLEELNGEKPKIGVGERMKLEKEAELGHQMSGLEATAHYLPGVGKMMDAEQNRQEAVEKRLAMGEVKDPLEMIKLAQSIGVDQKLIDELVAKADTGARTIAGFKTNLNADVLREGLKQIVLPKYDQRIKEREAAQAQLDAAADPTTWQKIVQGTAAGASMVAEFLTPVTLAMGTAGNIMKRIDRVGKDQYAHDENGNLVLVQKGDQSEAAMAGAVAGGIAEQTIWTSPIVWKIFAMGGKALTKIPGVSKLAAGALKGVAGMGSQATEKLAQTAGGRLLLKTGEVLGKIEDKVHVGSLPNMVLKSRVTELLDDVVGLNTREGEGESFGDWLEKVVSVDDNLELLTGIIGIHALATGTAAIKAHGQNKAFRGAREEVLGEYLSKQQLKTLSNEDIDNLYRIVTSDKLTPERVNQFLDTVKADRAAAEARMKNGETPEQVIESWKQKNANSQKLIDATGKIVETLEGRREITPEMEARLDEKIDQYAGGDAQKAEMIKQDIKNRLQDNRVLEEGNEDMLDEMVAMSTRNIDPEARRVAVHDLRGNKSVAEQVKGIEGLGVTSWEQAEQEGLIEKDQTGHYKGGARQALNIEIHGTEALKGAVKEGSVSGDTAEALITTAQCELGARPVEEQAALVDGVLERSKGDEAMARRMMEKLVEKGVEEGGDVGKTLDAIADEVKAEAIAERNGVDEAAARGVSVEPVETADGKITTVGEIGTTAVGGAPRVAGAPQTALEGYEMAERLKGTELKSTSNGLMNCNVFPEMRLKVSDAGVEIGGIDPVKMAKPELAADMAAVIARAADIAKRNGVKLVFDSEEAAKQAIALLEEVRTQGLARTQKRLDTRAGLLGTLFKNGLGTSVTFDEGNFKKALASTENGRPFVDNHGNIYGFVDGEGGIHFNPAALRFDTPFHEYGHVARTVVEKVNPTLWKRGMDLIKDTDYYREMVEMAKGEDHPYHGLSDDGLREDALCNLLGDRGAKLIEDKGVGAELKAWLKEFWSAVKGALGIADISEEQIEKMTLEQIADAINAELLRGSEFGAKKRSAPTKTGIKMFDEAAGSGSNGVLRWKNDRGYLLAIPVDLERTQPGGKVVLLRDDANITDWIEQRLNGVDLRLSSSGKLYVKGQNGFEGELAEIFGRYPTIGQNDGLAETLAAESGHPEYANATVEQLTKMLADDRAAYDAWKQNGRKGVDAAQEEYYRQQAEAEEAAARQAFVDGGGTAMDYLRERAMDRDEAPLDLDWEAMRELAHDQAEGRFSMSRPVERRKDLVAVHNMTDTALLGAGEHGGLAMPSVAIVKDKHGHTEYGPISLLMRPDAIDPKKSSANRIYSHDAWTPTFPELENDLDMKAILKVNKRIRDSVGKDIAEAVNAEQYYLGSEEGIYDKWKTAKDAAGAYANNEMVKAAYLASKGEKIEPVKRKKPYLTRGSIRARMIGEEGLKVVYDKIGKKLVEMTELPGVEEAEALKSIIPQLENIYRDIIYERDYKSDPEAKGYTKEQVMSHFFNDEGSHLDLSDAYAIAEACSKLDWDTKQGISPVEIDKYETQRIINDRVKTDDPAYVAWLNEQYGNPIRGRGVYNGKDRFTTSGRRRSWSAFHDPATLENIVKAMKKNQIAHGGGIFGANPFGVAVRRFSSLKDVIDKRGVLRKLTRDEEDAIKDKLETRLHAVIDRYNKTQKSPDSNPFIQYDQAKDAMLDSYMENRGSFDGIKRDLNRFGYTASDEVIKDFIEVMSDISLMPTNYFEAKPMRAVYWNDIAAAIVPDNISPEAAKVLKDNGQRVYKYKAEDEADRLAKVNQAADDTKARFSVGKDEKALEGQMPNQGGDNASYHNGEYYIKSQGDTSRGVIKKSSPAILSRQYSEVMPDVDAVKKGRYRFSDRHMQDRYFGASMRAVEAVENGRYPLQCLYKLFGAKGSDQKALIDMLFTDDYMGQEWHHLGKKANEVYFENRDRDELPITDVTLFAITQFKRGTASGTFSKIRDIDKEASEALKKIAERIETDNHQKALAAAKEEEITYKQRVRNEEIAAQYHELKHEMRQKYLKVPREEWDELRRRKSELEEKMYELKDITEKRTVVPKTPDVLDEIEKDPEAQRIISKAKKEILELYGRKKPVEYMLDQDAADQKLEELVLSKTHRNARFAAGDYRDIDTDIITWRKPGEEELAMGETEQGPAGLAAGIEKKEALRPWTKKQSPADLAKPIAFDAADMLMFWKAVTGSMRNPHVQKGERIAGRKNAIGMNVGGGNIENDRIEIVSKLFGVLDQGDTAKLKEACVADGFFKDENPDWCAHTPKSMIEAEHVRSVAELDKRTRELFHKRVMTGEGGQHYATEVLGHEIGHTLSRMPHDKNLGPVGNELRTLFEEMKRKFLRHKDPLAAKGEKTAAEEVRELIAWWHGQEKMPEYYEKPEERFAELFGIFLTQPESVHSLAPKAYQLCVDTIGQNERLARAYAHVANLKWSGKSNDAVMERLHATWGREAQDQYRELMELTKSSVSRWRDWFNYALNNRFGPMFGISKRGIAAERKRLKEAVATGAMSAEEAADRLAAMKEEVDSLKTSVYDWQRQSGGATRLMIAGFDEVKWNAEKEGVNWNDVRDYAHLMRVIELGGRATAHGVDPARAAAMLGDMARKMGAESWAKVEKTWKAYRAVYERFVLDDPNVKELFDDMTNKMLAENKHYVTMKHRMGVEEAADWKARIEDYRKGNSDAWDPCIDIQERLNKTFGGGGEGGGTFVLHKLIGSFEATEDPIAATMKRAIEIKESAARNHMLKQMSQTLRACGAKGVFDHAISGAGADRPKAVDGSVYGKLTYVDGGVKHEVIVPKVIYKSFKADPVSFGKFGAAMRAIRNSFTLWNPAFINRAYLVDKSSLETNIKGLHKAPIDILSEALCFKGIGVPLYAVNNYLARFTPIANTWVGKLLWNENTVNHYAHKAQKIANMVYEGKFGEHLAEARRLRENGDTARAAEIEQNVAICQDMMKRNVFQSAYQFNKLQSADTDDVLRAYGYRIGGKDAKTLGGKAWEKTKTAGRAVNRFEEEQEAVTKIITYLYKMKQDEAAGRTSEADAQRRARETIEYGGTPDLAARGVFASYIENATGFFWNVRKEGTMRTARALKDHPTEWIVKNLAQTALPAVLKGLMLTGGLEALIRYVFDDDEEKIKQSWWAVPVINHARWTQAAMKCVPGYYQENYNVIPLAKFGDEVLSLRVKYSPEEFAVQNAIHTAMQKAGKDPTDPAAGWTTLSAGMWNELFPNLIGGNSALMEIPVLVGPLVGINPYDQYRQRNVYDQTTWEARALAPGKMTKEVLRNFWNYSPLGSFVTTFKDGRERKLEDSEVPEWLDQVLKTPLVRMIPASMLTITSSDAYNKALEQIDSEKKAYARLKARDVLADCIARGELGGFAVGLKELPNELKPLAIRHVINGWRQFHMDPKAARFRKARGIKDPELRKKAMEWINDSMRYGD